MAPNVPGIISEVACRLGETESDRRIDQEAEEEKGKRPEAPLAAVAVWLDVVYLGALIPLLRAHD